MSVARAIGILPWCILSSRSLAGFASKRGKADDESAEDEKDNERCANGGAASKLARCVARKAMAVALLLKTRV